MKFLGLCFLFAAGAAATSSPNGKMASLDARDSFCGYDTAGNGWSCLNSGTECCAGSNIISCMPTGSSCCTTGYYCESDEDCYLDTVSGVQYCRKTGSQSTRTAAAQDAQETGSGSNKDSAASSALGSSSKAPVLLPVVAVVAVAFL